MAFKMKGHPLKKHKTGHIPPYEKGDNLKERFLAKRASKTEGKFEKYLDESGSVESPKGDRLAIRANKAAAAHQKFTDKRAKKAVAKRTRKEGREHNKAARRTEGSRLRQAARRKINKIKSRKDKVVAQGADRADVKADRKAARKNK